MTMSFLDKRSVCLRVTRHHRRLSSSRESVMDEADREVSTLTDRAFRSLCIGDEAVYSDAEFAGLSPSPGSCLLKPLADEQSRKVLENAPGLGTKKHSSNGDTTAAWQQKNVTSLLSAFTTGKNGNSAKMANGMLSESSTESWDKSALLSIQRELAEFSTDFHSGFADNRKHCGSADKKSSKKSGKTTSGAPVGKSNSKSKHSKSSSKLRKLNSRNFFLHSEFSPFQAWKDLQHFPFGQEHAHISDLLPSDSFPRWGDSAFYRHLTAANTLDPQPHTQLNPAHRSGPASALEGQRQGTEKHTRSQKTETAQRSQDSHKHTTTQTNEIGQNTRNILKSEQTDESESAPDPEQNRVESTQMSERVEGIVKGDRQPRTQEAKGTAGVDAVERLRQPLGGSTELLARPGEADTPSVAQTPSALELRRSSDSTEPIAPWRRNRVRARSAALTGHLEKSSPAADSRPPTSTELARKQEVRRMEDQSSDSVTPFNITHLLTPVIPCRQDTESLDPVALPALFSPTTLDVPAVSASERKPSPDTRARESYRSIASSLLFNLKDNRKRVKARYSPPKFRPTDPCDPTRLDWVALGKDLTDTDVGTLTAPVMGDATAMSPALESSSRLALPGNQLAESRPVTLTPGGRELAGESVSEREKEQLSVPGGVSQGLDLSHGTENRSPSLNLYRRTSTEAEVAMETQEDRAIIMGQNSRPIRKEKEPSKKSVKERVKELQGQSTGLPVSGNRDSTTRSKEKPPVGMTGVLEKGEHGETVKNRPPEVPAKPSVLPKPAKQPPPVPARVKYPLKNDPDVSAADAEARLVTVRETAFSSDAKHAFSARQNNYIKSQRSAALLDDEEKREDWDEVREVALLKQMQAEIQAHQEWQQGQHRAQPHTQSAPNESLHSITSQSNESSRAKNTTHVNSEDQASLKGQDSASPAPERQGQKGVLSLKGNTLAKRHLFSHLEQAHSQPPGRHSKKENDTMDKYDLATMALEEVIAEREEKKRKGQGSSAEPSEQRQVESRIVLSEQREGELDKVLKKGGVEISEDMSVVNSSSNHSIHSERQAANTKVLSPPGKLAQDGRQRELPSHQQIDHNREGKEGQRRRGGGACTDKTNPERTGQGKGTGRGAGQADQALERVKEQGSFERERGDRMERTGESGAQKVRTPPAVPPRKGRPSVRDEERTDPEGLRERAERPTEGDTTGTRTGDHAHVGRKTEKSAEIAKNASVPRETQNNKQTQLTPASGDSILSPTSRDSIQSPASRDSIQSPANRDSIQSPANRHLSQSSQATTQECSTQRDTKTHTETYTQKRENKSSEKYKDNQHKTDTITATAETSSKQSVTDSQHKPDKSKSETVLAYTPKVMESPDPALTHTPNVKECPHPTPKVKECPDPTEEQEAKSESVQKVRDSEKEKEREKDRETCGQREEVRERNVDTCSQKEQKVKQGRSYVKDLLSLLGLASEEKANADEDTEVERDISKPDPASPEPPSTDAPLEASVTIHDILKLRSPALSPLTSPVMSPSLHSNGSSSHRAKENSVKAELDYCIFSNPGSESDTSERLMSPLSDMDKGGWVRSLIEHAHNLSPKNLTPVSLTPSQSNASSPTPAKPVLFKVKDNTFATSPVTKTVRPILHKSVQDVMAQPWSPRESLSGSDRGSERGSEKGEDRGPDRGEADLKGLPGIPILVETASSPLLEDSTPIGGTAPVATGAPTALPSQQPLGQMLAVPEEEAGRSSVSSGISSSLSECMKSTGDTCDETQLSAAQTDDTEGSKAPSEHSGSVCSGTEGSSQSRKPPPAVLPKTEKALRRAMKLTTRRIQKAEGKGGKTDRKHHDNGGEGTEHDQRNRKGKRENSVEPEKKSSGREKSELKQKNRQEHPEREQRNWREEHLERDHKTRDKEKAEQPQLEQNHHGNTDKHARGKSEHISHHGDRKGRSGEKHARLKHVSHSTDRHIGNHRELRSYANGRVSSEHAPELQRGHPQPSVRQSPGAGAGSHGDRRSRSLERDVPVQSEVLHQRLGQPYPGRCPRQPHDIVTAAESLGISPRHPSLNGFLTRQDSSEQTHTPVRTRQESSEHTHHHSAMHCNSSGQTHMHHPSTGHMNSSDHTHPHYPSAGHMNSSDHTHPHYPSDGHMNSSDHTYLPSTRRQDTHHHSTVRQNSSEHQYPPSMTRQNRSEQKYPPSTLRQNSSDFSYPPSSSSNLMTQAYPMTQRKLLQDPDSGQYFVVDMPVQVTTKTFFDPETSSYVQLPVQSAEGALPSGPSLEVLKPSLVLYHGFVPVPASSQPTAKSSSSAPRARSGDTEDIEDSAPQWPEDSMHNKCNRNEHPYIEPVYVPKDHTPEEELDSVR